jgi:hypothetical protein
MLYNGEIMISIIIPTCTKELVERCINSIIKYTVMSNIELIVVANGAAEEAKKLVLPIGGKMIWFDERIGVTKALNEGIKVATGEYIILLNDDIELLKQNENVWIDTLMQPFKSGLVSITGPLKKFDLEIEQDFLIFFCVMIKKSMFEEIGLLDESLKCGCDIDFSIRVKKHGYSIAQVPDNKLVGGFPIYHAAEKTVLSVYSPEEWGLILKNELSMLIDKHKLKTPNQKNKIGIVVPVYNGEKYISKAIESILNQTFKDWLLFIVDDCSTDNTYDICKSYAERDNRINVFKQEKNLETSQARNRALNTILNDKSIGFVAYCDADDTWEPDHLMMGMGFLNDADMVYSDAKIVFEDGSNVKPFGIPYYDSFDGEKLKLNNYIYMSTAIHKVECLKIGGSDPNLNSIEDWDFWLRIYESGFKIIHNSSVDTTYLVRPNGNASRRTDDILKHFQKKHFLTDISEDKIKLNIACGDKIFPGYINMDLYNPKANVKGDVRHLPFNDNYADEILASHIIEHFTFREGFVILEEWKRVLKTGGKLIIECPDFMALCRLFVNGDEQERLLLYNGFYGAVEGEGMLHKFGYTPTQMRWTLGQLGFTNIIQGEPTSYPESKRMNMRFECQK